MNTKEIKAVRGTIDWFDEDMILFSAITNKIIEIANQYAYERIKTPVFEHAELFNRNLEHSDIVKKELYQFNDLSQRLLALRPEGTASVMRAINEHKLLDKKALPLKLFYLEPMFRYERPQKGRMREFHQFGIELVGDLDSSDYLQTILFANKILNTFKLKCVLNINWIGNFDSRQKWVDHLNEYFKQYYDQLTELSQSRLGSYGVLRILDDKLESTKDFVKNAPGIEQFISQEEQQYFKNFLNQLDQLNIKYVVNKQLVRGLDYYSEVVFEFILDNQDKSQSTLLAGGCYQTLVKELTDKDHQAIGFALSIERFICYLDEEIKNNLFLQAKKDIYLVINLEEDKLIDTIKLTEQLRDKQLNVFFNPRLKKLDKAIKYALRAKYSHLIILGYNEWQQNTVTIKNLDNQEQQTIKLEDFIK
ncbi:histidine--tRNA ligase [Mycoplasma bradburyae]|uniref:Histidine--tRNA ligase n=1 Tax=Mycoplasma bradburyae TaxID=2963128 RepID=A0AAW6HP81_9MOLU|nr:histidine--tRNA ligase [Mycoplasma bradburyae]MDC4183585.1 histidine--tRNA ligase [Mycoplasma bradburyae]UTS71018.1 histidine--tRNA ligase [Mycoplasma bradburyae]